MCGIFGAITSDDFSIENNILPHRGPDDWGVWRSRFDSRTLTLFQSRLSIIGLGEQGHQPFKKGDGSYLIFNGEIYNYKALRTSLFEKFGVIFQTDTDTEVLYECLINYGVDKTLELLNGIFAFAWFEAESDKLYVVRDNFGVKPLYYISRHDEFYFSSEIKAFKELRIGCGKISQEALANYIHFLWSPGEMTPFDDVKKLLPGHYLCIDLKGKQKTNCKQYYEIRYDVDTNKTELEFVDELDDLLTRAVERQMQADVPIGFFLSGGLDSSAVVAIARKLFPNRDLPSFTIDTSDFYVSEGFTPDLYYAKKVAEHLNVDLTIVKADFDIVRDFDWMIYCLDEPQADPSPLNVLNICREARNLGIKVLIGGTAGDDLFSGYRRHQALKLDRYLDLIPSFVSKVLNCLLSGIGANNAVLRRTQKLLAGASLNRLDRHHRYFSWLAPEEVKSLFVNKDLELYDFFGYFKEIEKTLNASDDLNKMLYREMKTFLVDHNLNYTDKMSMATGVEARVPFLDKELVEFASRLPVELKMKGKETKYLLKKVMERYLPFDVIYRPKAGFGAPVRKWITQDLCEKLERELSEQNIRERGIFDYDEIKELIEKNKRNKIDASYSIWALLAIESWMQQFYDQKEPRK